MAETRDRRGMTIAILIAGLAVAWMIGLLVYGMAVGGAPMDELTTIASYAWGKGTLIDLGTGLLLFLGWVAYRERSWWRVLIWLVIVCGIANLGTSLYVLVTLLRSRDWREFWLGRAS